MIEMDVPVYRSYLRSEHALERHRERLDHRDLDAALTGGGRHLDADPAGADDHKPAARFEALSQRVAVRKSPEVVDALQPAARNAQPPRLSARRQQQAVEAESLPGGEYDLSVARVDSGGRLADAQL